MTEEIGGLQDNAGLLLLTSGGGRTQHVLNGQIGE